MLFYFIFVLMLAYLASLWLAILHASEWKAVQGPIKLDYVIVLLNKFRENYSEMARRNISPHYFFKLCKVFTMKFMPWICFVVLLPVHILAIYSIPYCGLYTHQIFMHNEESRFEGTTNGVKIHCIFVHIDCWTWIDNSRV